MSNYFDYKPEHFDVEKSEGKYGPIWVVTANDGPMNKNSDWTKRFVLKADFLMDKSWMNSQQPGVHVSTTYETDALKASGDWRGIYRTGSMHEALTWLIRDVNENQKLDYISDRISSAKLELSGAVDEIDEAVRDFPNIDLEEVMKKITDAYHALMVEFTEAKDETGGLA